MRRRNGTGTGMSRRELEQQRHRTEILEAAERVFVRTGYHAAAMSEIAREAEFGIGTLYKFFASKADLYARVVEEHVRTFMELLDKRLLGQSDAEMAIATVIELRLAAVEEHRGFFRVFQETLSGARLDPAYALPTSCRELHDRYMERVRGIFAQGVRSGQFDEVDPLYLALCLEGVTNAFAVYWSQREPEEALATRIAKVQQAFLGGIRRRPRVTTGQGAAEPQPREITPDALSPGAAEPPSGASSCAC